jgi:two-component system, NtrC family, sensor kinase
MTDHHKLLERQIKRFLAGQDLGGALAPFLAAVGEAYRDADADRELIERSFELMSHELTDRNSQLRTELAERQATEQALITEKAEQAALIQKLEEAHNQLLQAEKLASIGQLAAGVAHEINNPIGFVSSNLESLRCYLAQLFEAIDAHEAEAAALPADARKRLAAVRARIELDYLREDAAALLSESSDGIRRVRQIVQDLKDFSHVNESQWLQSDLRHGLDSTLNIVQNEVKYVADVVKEYGEIPDIDCLASQLNQVFLNMFVNASHAMTPGRRGTITVRTGMAVDEAGHVHVEIEDNGKGISPENLKRIFDPFFTTKPVGVGTGLGLSLAYGIVGKHHGRIEVRSEVGSGTCFRIVLPVRQQPAAP